MWDLFTAITDRELLIRTTVKTGHPSFAEIPPEAVISLTKIIYGLTIALPARTKDMFIPHGLRSEMPTTAILKLFVPVITD